MVSQPCFNEVCISAPNNAIIAIFRLDSIRYLGTHIGVRLEKNH